MGVSINYTRALFGTLPECEEMEIAIADPLVGCTKVNLRVDQEPQAVAVDAQGNPSNNDAVSDEAAASKTLARKKLVLTDRGGCRFEDKAVNVANAGGAAVFVGNQASSPVCPLQSIAGNAHWYCSR